MNSSMLKVAKDSHSADGRIAVGSLALCWPVPQPRGHVARSSVIHVASAYK